MKIRHALYAGLMACVLVVTGCTTTRPEDNTTSPSDKRTQINSGANDTLTRLYATVPGAREMGNKASAILVFPSVVSAGFVVGGEYGEGVLRERGANTGYYRTAGGSFGFQAGAQSRAIVMMFMNQTELTRFKNSNGWSAGVDASVAVVKAGVNGGIDTDTARAPVVAFALTNGGLMANLTLGGSKITKLDL